MKGSMILLCLVLSLAICGQDEQTKELRAFPLTGYFVDLDDTTRVVQVLLPEGLVFAENQPGLIRGVYRGAHADTAIKGFGKCRLIKENYYYFAIQGNKSGIEIKEGDLIYTFMPRENIFQGQLAGIAGHFISLLDVYEQPFYDPYTVFSRWTGDNESFVLDTMIKDIRFTGQYFANSQTTMEQFVATGPYKGRNVFDVMKRCTLADLQAFLDYVKARPLLYAGRNWKLSEVFATWVVEGAPTVVREKGQ